MGTNDSLDSSKGMPEASEIYNTKQQSGGRNKQCHVAPENCHGITMTGLHLGSEVMRFY